MNRIKNLNNFINENTLMFDERELDEGNVRFYLMNPATNKGFAFDVQKEDKETLANIFSKNNIIYEIEDSTGGLPF